MMKKILILPPLLAIALLFACNSSIIKVPPSPYPISKDKFSVDTLATGFTIPYGIAVVSDSEFFVSDRVGYLSHWVNDSMHEVAGIPRVASFGIPGVPAIMHGGLMDLSLHPDYAHNGWIYMAYLGIDGRAKLVRMKIANNTAAQFDTLFVTRKEQYTGNGMRMVWEDEHHVFLNLGRSDLSTREKPVMNAQDLQDDAGKIHRLMDDGSIPPDNPVFPGFTAPGTIWSYGHRDVQGLYYDTVTHTLFGAEHGPKGGDEFNIIAKGKNYGWPLFSYGINYDGAIVAAMSADSAATFSVLPEHYWTVPTNDGGQAIAPACLLYVRGSNIADWNGYFLLGSLAYGRLMKYNRDTQETVALSIEGRVRTIQQLPGGDIIALIERNDIRKSNGMIVRIRR